MTDSNATELCFSDGCRDPEVTGGWPDEFDGDATLLPCPFCGGEAETFNPFGSTEGTWCVICRECASANGFEQTEAEAIEAWNSRAERTCNLHGEWKRISQTQEVRHLYCDCGEHLGSDKRNLILECKAVLPNYCPNCGAKVVDA